MFHFPRLTRAALILGLPFFAVPLAAVDYCTGTSGPPVTYVCADGGTAFHDPSQGCAGFRDGHTRWGLTGCGAPTMEEDLIAMRTDSYLLGAYYMLKPGSMVHQWDAIRRYNRELEPKTEGGQRHPTLGYSKGDDVAVMRQQIDWAARHGLEFFIFNDYWTFYDGGWTGVSPSDIGPSYDTSVAAFLAADDPRMKFAINLTVLTPAETPDMSRMLSYADAMASYWATEYFSKPSYFRIGGKPLVTVLASARFTATGITDWASWIQQVKATMETAAGEEIFLGLSGVGGFTGDCTDNEEICNAEAYGYDALLPYKVTGPLPDGNFYPMPHSAFVSGSNATGDALRAVAESSLTGGLKFAPSPTTNFDVRNKEKIQPSEYPSAPHFTNPTLGGFRDMLLHARSIVDTSSAALVEDGRRVVLLGTFNEWNEDSQIEPGVSLINALEAPPSFLAPDTPAGFEPLRTVTEVFGGSGVILPGAEVLATEPRTEWQFFTQKQGGQYTKEAVERTAAEWFNKNGYATPIRITESATAYFAETWMVGGDGRTVDLRVPTSAKINDYSKIEIVLRATCNFLTHLSCLEKVKAKWQSTTHSEVSHRLRAPVESSAVNIDFDQTGGTTACKFQLSPCDSNPQNQRHWRTVTLDLPTVAPDEVFDVLRLDFTLEDNEPIWVRFQSIKLLP